MCVVETRAKDILFHLGFIGHRSTWAVAKKMDWRESILFGPPGVGGWDPLPLFEVKHVTTGPATFASQTCIDEETRDDIHIPTSEWDRL